MTCNDCPWNYDYEDVDYAEDCIDFRYNKFLEIAFLKIKGECRKCIFHRLTFCMSPQ